MPAQMAIARARSFGSVKMLVMIDKVAGMTKAAPRPMTERAPMSWPEDPEIAARPDATAKMTRPSCSAPRRPKRSPRAPAVRRSPAKTIT